MRFLAAVFGASGEYRADRPSVLNIGDSAIMVGGTGVRRPTAATFYVYVEDTDATFQRALQAGAVCVEEPGPTPYGDRRAMVTDPFGNDWQIATYFP